MEAGGSAELHPTSVTDTHVQTGTLERAATSPQMQQSKDVPMSARL